MKSGYLYYASDKAVYDALMQHNFKNADIREIFLSRGILISDDTPREDVALYFSTLNHDYYDHQRIASIFSSTSRKERTKLTRVRNSFNDSKLEYVASELKKELESKGAEVNCVWKGKSFELHIRYEEYNSNKSEFKQTVEREGLIEIDLSSSDFLVRHTDNKFIDNAKDIFLDFLSKQVGEDEVFNHDEISLKTFDSNARTLFFKNLLFGIPGFKPKDVSDVYVYNPKIASPEKDDTEIGVHITKISFKGEGLLSSPELDAFFDAGFYINRVTWTCIANNDNSDIFDIDAQFSAPDSCEGFAYVVRGIHKLNDKGFHNKQRTACDLLTDKKMLRLIEESANNTLTQLKANIKDKANETD
ncbi:hypothetical protein UYA_05010 [Ectopseudomonas alcaliphila JAB1]|nr:hypothetical protein [Pseudomonas alcaliphila]APU29125.1 hypothetical protein UYA_05010 [Pseudomonas alcaliphila JAB1]